MYSYSPFSDVNGNKKDIHQIDYSDLSQLSGKEIKEGFQIEYKSMFSDSVFKKLPKIICSFANERGGWLFIGIDENTLTPCPIPTQEFELRINEKLLYQCSPVPYVIVKFISTPDDSSKGVLVIKVLEGRNPPYICNGVIYRRVGSGSSPIKEVDDRFFVDKLYQKAGEHREKIEKFCNKTISVYNRTWNKFSMKYNQQGMCNIYIIPMYYMELLGLKDSEEWPAYFSEQSQIIRNFSLGEDGEMNFGMNMPFFRSNYSVGSVIFRNASELDSFQSTCAWEQTWSGAAKFHIPISYLNKLFVIKKLTPFIKNVRNSKLLEEFSYINGRDLVNSILGCYINYFYAMKNLFEDLEDFIIVIDLENVRNDVLFFDTDQFYNYIQENGLPFSDKNNYRINEEFGSFKIQLDFMSLVIGAISVFPAFGMEYKSGLMSMVRAIFTNKT
ncbi:MAG: ATP-binding protein [Pelosinus sp.]|nr:ATP-binding protein [Pelosinus sp.]